MISPFTSRLQPRAAPDVEPAHDTPQARECAQGRELHPAVLRGEAGGKRRRAKPDGSQPRTSKFNAAEATNGAAEGPAPVRTSEQKLPKGWIIDEEGFVVPGPVA